MNIPEEVQKHFSRGTKRPWSEKSTTEKFARELAIYEGWNCWYCGINLLPYGEEGKYVELNAHGNWGLPKHIAICEVDHYVPKSRGGTDDMWNLHLSCPSCNSHKGVGSPYEFELKMQPVWYARMVGAE